MSPLAYTFSDAATMLRRNLKHQLRYPSVTLQLVGLPIVFLLLFVYVFGGQLGADLDHAGHTDRTAYLTYVVPGILDHDRGYRCTGHRVVNRNGRDRGHH